MKSKFFKDTYTQVLFNVSFDKQKNQTLRFFISVICLLLIVIMLQQKAIAQTLGINTTGAIPDSSAMLDIISPSKGLLIPRVSLTSTTDITTITNPATSLLVYNTNASMTGGSGLGYYYYNGSLWVNFVSGSSSSNYVQNQVASDQAAGLRMTGNGLFNGGQLTIGTATPSSGYLLTMNTSSGVGKGLNLTLSGGSGTGINVTSANAAYNGILVTNSSSSVSSVFYGFGSVLSNANIVSGYSGYRTSAGLSYGIYGINGTSALYATNASTWAAFLRGRTVISSETSPSSGLGTDLEVRNTTSGAGNPVTVSMRQSTSNTANATVLANLNFGDNHQTGAQAQIQITRGATGGASDLPTDMIFSTTPDASTTLTERMRILNNGTVGIGIISPSAKLHTLSTTEQLRLGYDASNYYSTTVGSTGAVTFDAVGTGSAFTFSDAVNLPSASVSVTQALNDSTTKLATTAFVDRAVSGVSGGSGWGLTGTSGTIDSTNFIGTTDNTPFNIRVNNQKAGKIDPSLGNTFWGYQAGNDNSSGWNNVATGYQSLNKNTTGYYNTANGHSALYNNTTGTDNTANGNMALYNNTTGVLNTANGNVTLYLNTTGSYNTAIGAQALYANTTGSWNTATGMQALGVCTTGEHNTATGYGALLYNTTGYQNTGHGLYAGNSNSTGYQNSFFGNAADASSATLYNATAIGAWSSVNASNKVRIGNSSVTVIEGQVAYTSVSDGRFKKNISESDVKGLSFIMRLRPVVYNIDTRQFEEFLVKNKPDSVKVKHFKNRDFTASTAIRHSGFVAQEVEVAAQATNYDFGGLHKPENADDNYGLAYAEFVVPLVKAMQEQQKIIDDLLVEVEKLKVEVSKNPK